MMNSPEIDPPARQAAFATIEEASAYTRLSARTLRRSVGQRKLKTCRVGRRVLFSYQELDRFMLSECPRPGGNPAA